MVSLLTHLLSHKQNTAPHSIQTSPTRVSLCKVCLQGACIRVFYKCKKLLLNPFLVLLLVIVVDSVVAVATSTTAAAVGLHVVDVQGIQGQL